MKEILDTSKNPIFEEMKVYIKNRDAETLLFEVKKKGFRNLPKKNQRFGNQNLTILIAK